MKARMAAVAATVVALLFGGAAPAAAQGVETGLEHYQGHWTWNDARNAQRARNNVSRIQFTGANRVVYCYDATCWRPTVNFGAGGSYTFSTQGRNRFEFSPLDGSRMMARFWFNFGPNSQAPDATAVFTYKGGH